MPSKTSFLNAFKSLFFCVSLSFLFAFQPSFLWSKEPIKACYNTTCFSLEHAQTPEEKSRGLMFRKYLKKDHGMLFSFNTERIIAMWMKNTYIPLDILWIDSAFTVVHMVENTRPLSTKRLQPKTKARYVIELNSGSISSSGITLNETIDIKLPSEQQ